MLNIDDFIITLPTGEKFTIDEVRADATIHSMFLDAVTNPDYLYKPDSKLIQRIKDYKVWCQTRKGEDPGKLMEEIAYLAFRGLRGCNMQLSYQSFADQFDLVVSGDGSWDALVRFLGVTGFPTIVVEAKNIDKVVDVSQFTRLCAIVQNNFEYQCALGVFVTREGAAGFPKGIRKRSFQHAWATQIIFHAKTKKFVVVLDTN
jgi:hypothetical protein